MARTWLVVVAAVLVAGLVTVPAYQQRYAALQLDEVVTLTDRQTETVVTIVPSVGNIATGMRVKGHNVLRYPHTSLAEFRERPGATGIPFMGPWINRLDEPAVASTDTTRQRFVPVKKPWLGTSPRMLPRLRSKA